jgi:hypothetical protein
MGKQIPVFDDKGNELFTVSAAMTSIGVAKRLKVRAACWAFVNGRQGWKADTRAPV